MAQREVVVRCPGCGHGKTVSLAIGQLLQCDLCRTAFQAPVLEEAAEQGVGTADGQADVAETPSTTAGAESGAGGSAEGDTRAGTGPSDSQLQPTRSWQTDDLGFEVQADPQSGSVGAADPAPQSSGDAPPEESALMWTIISVIAVAMIVLALSVLAVVGFRQLTNPEAGGNSDVAQQPPSNSSEAAGEGSGVASENGLRKWTDASRYSQRLREVTVKVERAFYGSVRVKDLSQRVITTEDENLLAVTLSVHNQSTRPREFQNWYGHAFLAEDGSDVVAELVDDRGRPYTLLKFDDVSYVEGQRVADEVRPNQMVQDTVVFLIPEETDRGQIKYFRLSLPAAAVSLSGTFRFQIPVRMIEGFSNGEEDGSAAWQLDAER